MKICSYVSNRQKIQRLLFLISVVLLISACAYSQDAEEKTNWNEIDYYLFHELKKDPKMDEARIYQAIGLVHIKEENWYRSAVYFKRAIKLNPELYWSWYNLGLLFIDTEEGNKYFKKTIEINPDFPTSYYWLAYCYCRKKKDKEAIPIFKKYLEVAEGNPSETARYSRAAKILKELLSRRVGEELLKIRHIY